MGRRAVQPSTSPKGNVWGIAGVSGRSVEQEVDGSTDDRPEVCAWRSILSLPAGTLGLGPSPSTPPWGISTVCPPGLQMR